MPRHGDLNLYADSKITIKQTQVAEARRELKEDESDFEQVLSGPCCTRKRKLS